MRAEKLGVFDCVVGYFNVGSASAIRRTSYRRGYMIDVDITLTRIVFSVLAGFGLVYVWTHPVSIHAMIKKEIVGKFPLKKIPATRVSFSALMNQAEHKRGTVIGGIPWSNRFFEVRLDLFNPNPVSVTDLDVVITTDQPIVDVGQVTNLPDVLIYSAKQVTITPELVNPTTGARQAIPLVQIATSGGYRALCKSIPPQTRLELVLAISSVIDSGNTKKTGDPGTNRDDVFTFTMSDKNHVESKLWYGLGKDENGRIEDVFALGSAPTKIIIKGSYFIEQEKIPVAQQVDIMTTQIKIVRK